MARLVVTVIGTDGPGLVEALFLIQHAILQRTEAHTGAVTLIQGFGSAANLNIRLHCLVLDGVYRTTEGLPVFHTVLWLLSGLPGLSLFPGLSLLTRPATGDPARLSLYLGLCAPTHGRRELRGLGARRRGPAIP